MRATVRVAVALFSVSLLGAVPAKKPQTRAPACKVAAKSYLSKLAPLMAVFSEQGELARATPRIGLSERIAEMQVTRRQIAALRPPKCAAMAHFWVKEATEVEIKALTEFMAGASDGVTGAQFDSVRTFWETARRELEKVAGTYRPEPTQRLSDVTFADVCCRCGEPIAEGDWTTASECGPVHLVCPRDRTKTPAPSPVPASLPTVTPSVR